MRNREWSRINLWAMYLAGGLFFSVSWSLAAPSAAPVEPRKLKPTNGGSLGRDEILFELTEEDYLKTNSDQTPLGRVARVLHEVVSVKGVPAITDPNVHKLVTLFYSSNERRARPFFDQVIAPALENEKNNPSNPQILLEAARVRDVVKTLYQSLKYRLLANQFGNVVDDRLAKEGRANYTEEEIIGFRYLADRSQMLRASIYKRYPRFREGIEACYQAIDAEMEIKESRQRQSLASVDELLTVSGLDPEKISFQFKERFLSYDSPSEPLVPLYYALWTRAHQPGGSAETGVILTSLHEAVLSYEEKREKIAAGSRNNSLSHRQTQADIHGQLGSLFESLDKTAAKITDPDLSQAIVRFGDHLVSDYSYQAGTFSLADAPDGIRFQKGDGVILEKGPHAGMRGYFEMTRGKLTSFVVEGNAPTGQYEVRRFGMRVNEDGSLEGLGWVSREAVDSQSGQKTPLSLTDLRLFQATPSDPSPKKPESSGGYLDIVKEVGSSVLEYAARPFRYVAGMVSVSAGATISEFHPSSGSGTEAISLALLEWGTSTMGEAGIPSLTVAQAAVHREPTQIQYAMTVIPDDYMATYSRQVIDSGRYYRTTPWIASGIDQETFDQVFTPMVMGFKGIDDQAVMLSLSGWNGQQVKWNYEVDFEQSQGRFTDANKIMYLAAGAAGLKRAGEILFVGGLGGGPVRWVLSGSSRGSAVIAPMGVVGR